MGEREREREREGGGEGEIDWTKIEIGRKGEEKVVERVGWEGRRIDRN